MRKSKSIYRARTQTKERDVMTGTINKDFSNLMLTDDIVRGLKKNSFNSASYLQRNAINLRCSCLDLLIETNTRNGKEPVIGVIILEAFKPSVRQPQSLVLASTRENAMYMAKRLAVMGSFTSGFSVGCFFGELDNANDLGKIEDCRAIIGTPERILHLISTNILSTDEIGILVLAEADQLINSSFQPAVQEIWCRLNQKRQVLAFSPTFEGGLDVILSQLMRNPIFLTYKLEVPIALGVKQFAFIISTENISSEHSKTLIARLKAILRILHMVPFKQCIIFSNEQSNAERCCNYLSENGWLSDVLTGCPDENVNLNLQFQKGQGRILVATDVMARGVNSENVNLIISLDLPAISDTYLYRISRCSRFSTHGMAITLLDEKLELTQFQNFLGTMGGPTIVATKFPHYLEIEDIWTYKAVDVREKIFGAVSTWPGRVRKCMNVPSIPTILRQNNGSTSKREPFKKRVSFDEASPLKIYYKTGIQQTTDIADDFALMDLEDKAIETTECESSDLNVANPFEECYTQGYTLSTGSQNSGLNDKQSILIPENSLIQLSTEKLQIISGVTEGIIMQESAVFPETRTFNIQIDIKPTEESSLQPCTQSVTDFQCLVKDQSDIHQPDDVLSTNGAVSESDSINGHEYFEAIFQIEKPQTLPNPPTAAIESERLTTSKTSYTDTINRVELYELDVSSTSTLNNTTNPQLLQANLSDTLLLYEDIIVDDDTLKLDIYKAEPTENKDQPKTHEIECTVIASELPNDKPDLPDAIQIDSSQSSSSACLHSVNDLIDFNETLPSAAKTLPDVDQCSANPFD